MTIIPIAGFHVDAVQNGYVVTVFLGDGEDVDPQFVALDKPALSELISKFIGQMPTPEATEKETRQ